MPRQLWNRSFPARWDTCFPESVERAPLGKRVDNMKARKMCVGLLFNLLFATAFAQDEASERDFYGVYAPPLFRTSPALTEPETYPLTPQARLLHDDYEFEPAEDDCAPVPMPKILWVGSPMSVHREGDTLIIRSERLDTVRTIRMTNETVPTDLPHSELGYSVGRWEGNALMIETTHLLEGHIHRNGYPMSSEALLTERYWRQPGQKDLQLELTVDDPVNYTSAFSISREWVWAPDDEVKAWDCFSLSTVDSDADLEDLIRHLEESD